LGWVGSPQAAVDFPQLFHGGGREALAYISDVAELVDGKRRERQA
jgi:hypothetical protein